MTMDISKMTDAEKAFLDMEGRNAADKIVERFAKRPEVLRLIAMRLDQASRKKLMDAVEKEMGPNE